MHIPSGDVGEFEEMKKLYSIDDAEQEKKDLIEIPETDVPRVKKMNRKARRRWAALQRKKQ